MTARKGPIGSSFEDFLREDGLHEEVTAAAIKRVLARQILDAMAAARISKSEMARRMKTSRSQLDRLLDPENTKIQLDTLYRAANAVGKTVHLEIS